jgi:two-component system KDP operon response regulator KdpE
MPAERDIIDVGRLLRTGTHDPSAGVFAARPHDSGRLATLLRCPGKLLLPRVGGPADHERAHYLREYLGQLRRQLEPDRHLIIEPGLGYRFQPPTDGEPTGSDGKGPEPGRCAVRPARIAPWI